MEAPIGAMVLVGDVWFQVMAKQNSEKGTEYWLYSLDRWIPESFIKDVKGSLD
jgi:hypothetical protein